MKRIAWSIRWLIIVVVSVMIGFVMSVLNGCTQSTPDKPLYSNVNLEGLRSGNQLYITGFRTSDGVLHSISNTRWIGVMN